MPPELNQQDQDTTPNPQDEQQQEQLPAGTFLHTLSEDDEDDGGDSDLPLDKRGRRSWAREAKQKLAEYENKFSTMERELAELRNRPAPQPYQQPVQQQPQQQSQQSEAEQEIAYWEQQMDTAVAAIQHASPNTPQSVLDQHRNTYKQAQRQLFGAVARSQAPQQQRQDPSMSVEGQMLRAQFPQIFADDALRLEAQAEAIRISKQTGKPFSLAIAIEANQKVMQRHGIGQPKPQPTAAEKAKLAGTAGRAGASGANGNQVPVTQRDINDALAYFNGATGKYAQFTEKQKVDYWLKNVKMKQ